MLYIFCELLRPLGDLGRTNPSGSGFICKHLRLLIQQMHKFLHMFCAQSTLKPAWEDIILRIAQSTLHFISLTDLFNQTPSQLLWEASSHMLQLMREGCLYTYTPLSKTRYSFRQLSELEQCRVKKLAQGFNTAAQDSNQVPLSRESEALPLSHRHKK